MKKLILCYLLLALFGSLSLIGQTHQKGQLTISPTIGLRAPGAMAVQAQDGNYTIPAVVYVDYGLSEMISVGGIGGFRLVHCQSCSEERNGLFVSAGVRVNGHVFPILKKAADIEIPTEKLDVYLSLMGGAELNSHLTMVPRVSLGVRYAVQPKIALLAEVGSGFLSMFNFGATFRVL